jgi:hypothetical protein
LTSRPGTKSTINGHSMWCRIQNIRNNAFDWNIGDF